jgi:hypothetical protein
VRLDCLGSFIRARRQGNQITRRLLLTQPRNYTVVPDAHRQSMPALLGLLVLRLLDIQLPSSSCRRASRGGHTRHL